MTRPNVLHNISPDQLTPLSDATPIAIGGIGGSGTRLIARLLIELGYDMGCDLNDSLDDLGFTALFKRIELWPLEANLQELEQALSVYLTARGFPTPSDISREIQRDRVEKLIADIAATSQWREVGAIEDRITTLSDIKAAGQSWGWKEPNTVMVLPYLLHALPELKYIHVVRDGRDMAFSSNKNQLRLWGGHVLGRAIDHDSPQDAFDYWCAVHEGLLGLQEQAGSRVLLIKLEFLVESPDESLDKLLAFVGTPKKDAANHHAKLSSLISTPDSITRYRDGPPLEITKSQVKLMQKLGYPNNP